MQQLLAMSAGSPGDLTFVERTDGTFNKHLESGRRVARAGGKAIYALFGN
jgi:hypothetical protein